ncbi:probable leucine-rich repeat receptor-like protein kinase At1g35710 [Juglans regia]|uniref:Probable leucine-rich repeat receptor-like protein kinase At1g35710 n=1 Tax=Juglans regia TaxID=51240 RepID=A0A6P9EKS7_JUGRE|nr:probable leucine-rich repeat receptor-like protein kinase At1g35710 [Juglans regia]
MASSASISIIAVACVTCILFYGIYLDIEVVVFVAASKSSPLDPEMKALLETGWWSSADTNNSSSPSECYDISCTAGGRVTKINLAKSYLEGEIPLSIINLTQLLTFDIASNNIHGSIPLEMGNMESWNHLYLSLNKISGSIPTGIGNLKNLMRLHLKSNNLIGPVPTTLDGCSYVQELILSHNYLIGRFSHRFADLYWLNTNLSHNFFGGEIPV